jgi:hypothetical protein
MAWNYSQTQERRGTPNLENTKFVVGSDFGLIFRSSDRKVFWIHYGDTEYFANNCLGPKIIKSCKERVGEGGGVVPTSCLPCCMKHA